MLLPLDDTLQKLSAYENMTYPILSVYLNTFHKDHPGMLKNFRHLVVDYLTDDEQEEIKRNISYIMGFLETFPTPQDCKTLAIFSGGDHLWEVITTDLHIPEQIVISHTPYTKPIEEKIAEHKEYLILLADREKALLLKLLEGKVIDHKEIKTTSIVNEVPQKVKGRDNGMRADKIGSHIQDHLHRHFKHVGKEVEEFLKEDHVSGILIGSHKQLFHSIEESLPKEVKEKIMGEFIADLNAPLPDLIERSTKKFNHLSLTAV